MKRIVCFIVVLSALFSLCACAEMGKTADYRKFENIYITYQDGEEYTKQILYSQAGEPDYPTAEKLFDESTTNWQYDFYELPDPANPYRLVVEFDADGNVTNMEFDYIPGG